MPVSGWLRLVLGALPIALVGIGGAALLINPSLWWANGQSFGDGYLADLDLETCDPPPSPDAIRGGVRPDWWCYGPAVQVVDPAVARVRNVYVPDGDLLGGWLADVWEAYPLHPNAQVVVRVDGLGAWIGANSPADHQVRDTCEGSVRLVINGLVMERLPPTLCDDERGLILFQLNNLDLYDADAEATGVVGWREVLDSRSGLARTTAQISVAWRDERPLPTAVRGPDAATIVLFSPVTALLSIGGALISALMFWTFGASATLLRVARVARDAGGAPWSLRRVQAAWWFVVVFTSWEILAAFIRDIPPIGGSSLLLLTIAGGTYSADLVIPGLRDDPTEGQPSRGFVEDLVSDGRGPALHRVQMVVWSLVVGVAFVYKTLADLRMPELPDSLMGLVGLSAAGYLTGKRRESKAADESATAAPPAASSPG